jgi:D-alanyl-lipoteichoic acid acyltransferase DltB (MBOAT superfamily)
MLFNSLAYAVFLPVVYMVYWYVFRTVKARNLLLLVASYFFYAWWDWRFLLLLVTLSGLNYIIGIRMGEADPTTKGRRWLIIGIVCNLGILGFFKYFNFFIDGFNDILSTVGLRAGTFTINVILPLGISFYVFLSLSYLIDIFKKTLHTEKSIVSVLLSLNFFSIIVAGPIQRPASLLPQIGKPRSFDYSLSVDGLKQIVWGLFAKIVIADELAIYVDDIFNNAKDYSGSTLLVGIVFFTIQIYADFAGYSNIAIGTGKLFGFNIMRNFAFPYFASDISEFWKRWHISLTTWFRDYLFLPLSFSVSAKIRREKLLGISKELIVFISASIVTWILTGLWHGASYNFIVWGLLHGTLLILFYIQRKPRKKFLKRIGVKKDHPAIVGAEYLLTIVLIMLAWVFFRAESLDKAIEYLAGLFSSTLLSKPQVHPFLLMLIVFLFILAEWMQRSYDHPLRLENMNSRILRWSAYYLTVLLILFYAGGHQEFIYQQF